MRSTYSSIAPVKFGSRVYDDDVMVFNMGSATDCPVRAAGNCPVEKKGFHCYAYCAERRIPSTLEYRRRQERWWCRNGSLDLFAILVEVIARRRTPVKYLRFNEAGDFWSRDDINKLDYIAWELKHHFGITTFGYTARRFRIDTNPPLAFLCKGTEHNNGNNGRIQILRKGEAPPKGYFVCPPKKNCSKCKICMEPNNVNVAFYGRHRRKDR